MNLRGFLPMSVWAAVMPAIPILGLLAAPAAVANYSRYMFGLCMFHAFGKALLTAGELAANMVVRKLLMFDAQIAFSSMFKK